MVRRIVTTTAASLTALTVLAAPAWAGSSFTGGSAEATADEDHTLVLSVTEPEDEAYGDTSRVTATAPDGFTDVRCVRLNTWQCEESGATVTFTRTATSLGSDLRFSVHTPVTNGTYAFAVTQFDDAEEPATASSAPTVTVIGGEDPTASSDDGGDSEPADGTDGTDGSDGSAGAGSDTTDDGGGDTTSGDGTSDDSGADRDTAGDDGEPSDPATGSDDTSATTSDDTGDASGSEAPRRTEGRSSGTTLEITPGEPAPDDTDPLVAAPDVADEPAVAPPDDDDDRDEDAGTATMTAIEGEAPPQSDDGGGLPWQQLVGGALVAVAAAVVAVRRWDVLARFRG